jgi:4'-phosphopantetheinyl transferase
MDEMLSARSRQREEAEVAGKIGIRLPTSAAAAQIHVWMVDLDAPPDICASLLSNDEQARAARYHFELHRRRFICGRVALRLLLAEHLGIDPKRLQFGYAGNGKPYLRQPVNLSFNVAHCENLGLIAITGSEVDIGVDVEQVRWMPDFDELVSRFFSKREAMLFGALVPELKPAAFFNLWTRKEALLKATGEGIGNSLDRVEVTFVPGKPAQLLSLPEGAASDWTLREFRPIEGWVAAVAANSPDFRIRLNRFGMEGHMAEAEVI